MKQLYGVKLAGPSAIHLKGLKRHPLNHERLEAAPDEDRILTADIKQGQLTEIIVDTAGRVLAGMRRITSARKVGLETLTGYTVDANIPKEAQIQLIHKTNSIPRGYSAPDVEAIIKTIWTTHEVLDASRGNKTPLEKIGERLTGIPEWRIRHALVSWRRELTEGRAPRLELSPEEKNYARNRIAMLDREDKALAKLDKLRAIHLEKRRRLATEVTQVIPRGVKIKGRPARIAAVRKAVGL